jgi:hypothetical protein
MEKQRGMAFGLLETATTVMQQLTVPPVFWGLKKLVGLRDVMILRCDPPFFNHLEGKKSAIF